MPASRSLRPVLALAAAITLAEGASCAGSSGVGPAGGLHVLFIGNSLTYTNDLPETFRVIATGAADSVHVAAVALPNFAVIDHALGGSNAVAVIERGGWDFVVMQQGPTWPGLCLDTLIRAVKILDAPIRAVGARPALLMTWPSAADSGNGAFDDVRDAYRTAAQSVGAVFLPAGVAWQDAWRQDSTLALYSPDQYHPSRLGTYLAALVVYEGLTGLDARTLSPLAGAARLPPGTTEPTIRMLQQAAHDAILGSAAGQVARPAPAALQRGRITC